MVRKHYQAIVDAIDLLARGGASKSNGKLIPINVAREAGIGKATLYRYFEMHEALRKEFDDAQSQGVRVQDREIITVQDSLAAADKEVRELRARLEASGKALRLRDQQIFLLWAENKRLAQQLKRSTEVVDNVKAFPAARKLRKEHGQ